MELGRGLGHRSIRRCGWGPLGAQRPCRLGWPRGFLFTRCSFPSGAGGVGSVSVPSHRLTPADLTTNYRHLSPGIWLRALTGDLWGPWGRERRVLPDPWSSCFLHINDAGVLVFKPQLLPCPQPPSEPDGPRGSESSGSKLRCG